MKITTVYSLNPGIIQLRDNFIASCKRLGITDIETLEIPISGSTQWGSDLYWNIVKERNKRILSVLKVRELVFYVGCDVVFLRNPFPYLESLLRKYDFIAMSDFPSHTPFCLDFFIANKKAIPIFEKLVGDGTDSTRIGDQNDFNEILKNTSRFDCNAHILSLSEFCNGWLAINYPHCCDPTVIHYNWLSTSEEKIELMKKNRHWFLKEAN
jgi:hypothetical protein